MPMSDTINTPALFEGGRFYDLGVHRRQDMVR